MIFGGVTSAVALASPVTQLPEPDANGFYVFGSPYTYSGDDSYGWENDANTPAYPVWSELALPAGAKVKLTGGVILDDFPAGVAELDTRELTFLAVTKSNITNLSGLKVTIPDSAKICVCPGTVSVSGDTVSFEASANNPLVLPCDLELNGTLYWHKNTLTLTGAVSGSGTVYASSQLNFHCYFAGIVEGTVNIQGPGNTSQDFWLTPTSGNVSLGNVFVNGKSTGSSYLVVKPAYDDAANPMSVTMTRFDAGAGTDARVGAFFNIAHNRTADIGTLTGGRAYFQTAEGMTTTESDDMGGATIKIGNVNPAGKSSGTTTGVYHLSKNMSYEIGGIGTDLSAKGSRVRNITFTYAASTPGVNTNSLSIGQMPTGSDDAVWQMAKITAPTPALLPRRVTLPDNAALASGVNVEITGNAWSFDFDFSKADPCGAASAIEQEYALSVPETGTIAVTVPVGRDAPTPVNGVYPLLTCTSHGEALTAESWPATINGEVCESKKYDNGVSLAVVRGATGVSLAVTYKPKTGLVLIFR